MYICVYIYSWMHIKNYICDLLNRLSGKPSLDDLHIKWQQKNRKKSSHLMSCGKNAMASGYRFSTFEEWSKNMATVYWMKRREAGNFKEDNAEPFKEFGILFFW